MGINDEFIVINGVDITGCSNFAVDIKKHEVKCKLHKKLCKECPDCNYKAVTKLNHSNSNLAYGLKLSEIKSELRRQVSKEYEFILSSVLTLLEELQREAPESESCYYKDECGCDCTPKKDGKVSVCTYERIEDMMNLIKFALRKELN